MRVAPSKAASARGRRSLRDLLAMSRAAARARVDAMFFPSTYTFFPVWDVGPVIVTAFDTMPLDYPEMVFANRRQHVAWQVKERLAICSARKVVTTSEYSKRTLLRHYGGPAERYRVVPCAPSRSFQPIHDGDRIQTALGRYQIDPEARYLLYVGGLSPHKNLPRLIEAFAASERPELRFVIVGDLGDVFRTQIPEIREAVARHQVGLRVQFAGFVPDEDLACLYNAALALVQPSLIEGFGLPPVEAMACGVPVLASRAGSLPEVIGDAGLFFDPLKVHEMSAAIDRIAGDAALRAELALRAAARARLFRWSTAARRVVDELEAAVLGEQPRRVA